MAYRYRESLCDRPAGNRIANAASVAAQATAPYRPRRSRTRAIAQIASGATMMRNLDTVANTTAVFSGSSPHAGAKNSCLAWIVCGTQLPVSTRIHSTSGALTANAIATAVIRSRHPASRDAYSRSSADAGSSSGRRNGSSAAPAAVTYRLAADGARHVPGTCLARPGTGEHAEVRGSDDPGSGRV